MSLLILALTFPIYLMVIYTATAYYCRFLLHSVTLTECCYSKNTFLWQLKHYFSVRSEVELMLYMVCSFQTYIYLIYAYLVNLDAIKTGKMRIPL